MTDQPSTRPDRQQNPSSPSTREAVDSERDRWLHELRECVTSSDPTLRKWGLQTTCRLASRAPTNARPFLDPCLDAVADDDPDVRSYAARALVEFARAYPELVANSLANERVRSAFIDDIDSVRANTIRAIYEISRRTPETVVQFVPRLVDTLADPNDDVRATALAAITELSRYDPTILVDHTATVVHCLRDETADVRVRAAETVSTVATEQPCLFDSEIETLCRASRDGEPCVRHSITAYLRARAPYGEGPSIRSALFERLSDEIPAVRETAAAGLRRSIRRRSECSPEEVEELIDALADPEQGVRTNVGLALKHAGYEEYWRVVTESDAAPMTVARALLQTYRSMEELDPHAQLVGARQCSICRRRFETPKFDHPNVVCEECATEIEPYHSQSPMAGEERIIREENGKKSIDPHLEPSPISVCNAKCWRQFRLGELVVMRDAHDCDTYSEFLRRHFTRDGTPIQSVQFETEDDHFVKSNTFE